MNLHDIHAGIIDAWVWLIAVGQNGKTLGRGSYKHLYHVERGHPPFVAPHYRRNYWNPWTTLPHEQALHPLCGDLPTRATTAIVRQPYYSNPCPSCLEAQARKGITTSDIRTLATTDPWRNIPYYDRETTPDPVTGL